MLCCLLSSVCVLVSECCTLHGCLPTLYGWLLSFLAGTESPGAVRKIMALTDKVRPHNPKIPVPPVTSPGQGRRGPSSPRHTSLMPQGLGHTAGQGRMMPVRLTHESSSVVSLSNMPLRKPLRTGKTFSYCRHLLSLWLARLCVIMCALLYAFSLLGLYIA